MTPFKKDGTPQDYVSFSYGDGDKVTVYFDGGTDEFDVFAYNNTVPPERRFADLEPPPFDWSAVPGEVVELGADAVKWGFWSMVGITDALLVPDVELK